MFIAPLGLLRARNYPMLLIIDNIDSFTHNLARYFTELGQSVTVLPNNATSIADIEALSPTRLVISPGPGTPNTAGITLAAIEHFSTLLPILGVCLGHQAIGQFFGAKVTNAPSICHGKVKQLTHEHSSALFENLPSQFNVTRYHSLVLQEASMPPTLSVDAWCHTAAGEREIMAISHRRRPIYGVQFHPESLLTEYGYELLANFLRIT